MNKDVTKIRVREILAIILSALMIAGIFSCFSVLADESTEESTSGSEGGNTEDPSSVVLRADDLIGKLYASNATSAEIGERDGISVIDLTVVEETNDAFVYVDLKGYAATKYIAILTYADINSAVRFSIYYHTSARGDEKMSLGEDARVASPYMFGTGWQFLEYDMSNEPGWGGQIYTFRMDYLEAGMFSAGTQCQIAAIILADDAKAVHEAAYDLMTEIYTPVQTLSNFKESDVAYFNSNSYQSPPVNTQIEISGDALSYKFVSEGDQNDPHAMFDYLGYVDANGMQALTTDDFRYTVIRYRAPSIKDAVMELFTITGSAEDLFDMIRIEGSYACHSTSTTYTRTSMWSTMVLDMARDDGLEENTGLKYGWYREDGDRTFKGFRVDWCAKGYVGNYIEISDFIFYQDKTAAHGMAFALLSLNIGDDLYWGSDPEETTEEGGTIGGDIPSPWETDETTEERTEEETTEETVPEYVNTEEPTEETTEDVTEETAESTSDATTEEPSQEETAPEESEDESKSEITIIPGGIGGSGDEPEEKGSEMPFYIACGALALLSVASISTVTAIRIKEKRQSKTA